MATLLQRARGGPVCLPRARPAVCPRVHLPRPRIRLRCNATAASMPVEPSAQQPSWNPVQLWRNFAGWWRVESPKPTTEGEKPIQLGPVLKKLLALAAPDVGLLVMATIFMCIASICELAIPHFATKSIFAASEGVSSASFTGFLNVLTCMVATYGIFAALRGFCFSILNNRMTRRLRAELFASLARRETSFFDGEDVGNLTSRLQADCQAMTKVVATNFNIAFRNLLQAVGGVVYLYLLSPSLCGITLGISAVLWAVTIVYGDFARRMQKVFQDVLAESNTVAEEALSMSRVVRTFGTEGTETRRYMGWLDRLYQVGKRQAAGYALFVATGHIACYASKVAALAVGCGMVLAGHLTAEQLTNFIMYVEFVTYASLNVCDEFTEICEAVGASERVVAMLDAPPAPQVAGGATLPSFGGCVELKDVVFSYPSRPHNVALSGVSLTLQPGKLTALVGLSGSGKTTVCALLQRLYDPAGGAILLDGQLDLRQADAAWYRTQIGVVPQEPRLFSNTIADNISYGMEHAPPSRQQVEEAARAANAHDFIMALPKGYDTPVTDKLLSGGQKQRLALARALIRKPKLLVLDEFSSALDAESEAQVHAALDAAMSSRDRTVVVIAHRLSTVRHADVIVVMDKGKVYEMGSHHELLARRGIYWQLVCRQQYGIDPSNAAATDTDSEPTLAAAAAAAGATGADIASRLGAVSASASTSPLASSDQVAKGSNGHGASTPVNGNGSWNGVATVAVGNGSGNGLAAGRVPYGSTASMEEDVMREVGIGNATDNNDSADNGDGTFTDNGMATPADASEAGSGGGRSAFSMLGSSSSLAGSLTTVDDDIDEAGRPAGSGKIMSAVLAGVVVSGQEAEV